MRKKVDKKFVISLGKQVRKCRKKKGLTITQLANDLNIEYSQISRIELGKISTSVDTLKNIADVLEVDMKDLFTFAEDENDSQTHP